MIIYIQVIIMTGSRSAHLIWIADQACTGRAHRKDRPGLPRTTTEPQQGRAPSRDPTGCTTRPRMPGFPIRPANTKPCPPAACHALFEKALNTTRWHANGCSREAAAGVSVLTACLGCRHATCWAVGHLSI